MGVTDNRASHGAHRLDGGHRDHDRGFAAGAGGEVRQPPGLLRPDGFLEDRRIKCGEGREGLRIRLLRVPGRRVVGEVGTGHDQRTASLQGGGQRRPESAAQRGIRLADHRRDDPGLREEDLNERNLDLEGVLPAMRPRIGNEIGRRGQKGCRDLPVRDGDPQRRPETLARVEGHLPKARRGMVRPEQHDNVIGPSTDLVPAVGADLAGVDVPRMRDDNGKGFFHLRRQGVPHEGFNGELQDICRFGVELPGHDGGTHLAHPLLSRHAGCGHSQAESDDGNAELQNGHDLSPFQSTPDAGDFSSAEPAAAFADVRLHGKEPGTPEDGPPAGGAVRMVPRVARDVSHIDIP